MRSQLILPFFVTLVLPLFWVEAVAVPWNDPPRQDSIEFTQDSVISAANNAINGDSTVVDPYVQIVEIYKARKRFAQELQIAQRLIRIHPYNALANFTFADALLDNGLPDSAIVHLRRALVMEPEFVRARTTLADAYTMKKAYDTALWNLDTAIYLNPRYAQAHWQRGGILTTLGRDSEAVNDYQAAADLSPESFTIWMTLARTLLKIDHKERAADVLAYIRQFRPESSDATYLYAETSMKIGQVDEAVKAFEDFMLRFPTDRRALDAERLARRLREGSP